MTNQTEVTDYTGVMETANKCREIADSLGILIRRSTWSDEIQYTDLNGNFQSTKDWNKVLEDLT